MVVVVALMKIGLNRRADHRMTAAAAAGHTDVVGRSE